MGGYGFDSCHSFYNYVKHVKTINMNSFRTSEKVILDFCKQEMDTHTDWTGTRVETKYKCSSVEEFAEKLAKYLENRHGEH